ncbi:MAG: S41 family peptidase, partial [Acidimicrobiaceae bacterium]|nr:S41 family peptidase [Acidimicrobiaceae bacterium]
MDFTRRDSGFASQSCAHETSGPARRPIILLLLGLSLTLTSVLLSAPAGSAQDSAPDRVGCAQPPDDFVLLCLAFGSVVEHFVDEVVVADLAEAARQGVIQAGLAPWTGYPPPCALPAPEFEVVCAEIDRVADTRAAALAAVDAMLESLDDDNTRLLQPTLTRKFFSRLDAGNSRAGIGIEYALWGSDGNPCSTPSDSCLLTITEVYPGSPAEAAGLVVGDVIVQYGKTVSEHPCSGLLDLDSRDFLGESATIVVRRDGVETYFTLATAEVVDPLVASRIVDDSIGFIQLDMFANEATALFEEHLLDLLEAGVESLVVDLRNNPGGYLSVTERIIGNFLESGDLSHRTQSVRMDLSFFANYDGIASDATALPMAVTANGGSASGSELFLLAMRGNGRARIVGEATYGKSTGQLTFIGRSADGTLLGSVSVTTLRFSGPDGASAEGGVQPDTILEISDCAHPVAVAREAVEALVPRVSNLVFSSAPATGAYEPGEKVTALVHFDAPIVVDASNGEPSLSLEVGPNTRQAAYAGTWTDNGTSTIGFEYTIDNDADHDGISIGADSISLNGATIRRAASGWDAHLEHGPLSADPTQIVATDSAWFFTDISDTPFVDAINWLRHSAITTGCG